MASPEAEALRARLAGKGNAPTAPVSTTLPTFGAGISGRQGKIPLSGNPLAKPKTSVAAEVDPLASIPASIIQQFLDRGFTEQQIRQIISESVASNFISPFEAAQKALQGLLQNEKSQQDLQPADPRQFNQTFEDLQVKAIQEGNFDLANTVRKFQEQPSDIDIFNAAVSLATSPADIATLSAIARGVFPRQAPSPGNVQSLPVNPALQRAGENLFGLGGQTLPEPTGTIPIPATQPSRGLPAGRDLPIMGQEPAPFQSMEMLPDVQSFPLPQSPGQRVPTVQPQRMTEPIGPTLPFPGGSSIRERTEQEARGFTRFPSGPSGIEPIAMLPDVQRFGLPARNLNDPTPEAQRVSAGVTPGGVSFAPGSSGASLSPETLARLTRAQIEFLGGTIQQPAQRPARSFEPQPSQNNPFIPQGTPVSSINLNGRPAEVPVGIGQLFAGIQGNQTIDRPQSGLGAVGLPLPSAQGFSRLTAAEQDEFRKLAASQGLDPRDVERELGSTRFSGLPRPNITS